MKKILLLTTTLLLSVCLFAQSGEAQGRPQKKEVKRIRTADSGDRMHKKPKMQQAFAISGLTEEQRNSIKELRLAMVEEVGQNAKLLREKRVQLNTLQKAENPDKNAINNTIDEITALQGQIMKLRADFRAKISGVLTEEQRAAFQDEAVQMRKDFSEKIGDKKAVRKFSSESVSDEDKKFRVHEGEGKEIGKGKLMKAKKAAKAD